MAMPDDLFTGGYTGDVWVADPAYLYTDAAKTTPVTAAGDKIGCWTGAVNSNDCTASGSDRPEYAASGGAGVPQSLLFTNGQELGSASALVSFDFTGHTTPISIGWICKAGAGGANSINTVALMDVASSAGRLLFQVSGLSSTYQNVIWGASSSTLKSDTPMVINDTVYRSIVITFDGAGAGMDYTHWVSRTDGAADTVAASGAFAANFGDVWSIGGPEANSRGFTGNLAMVMVVDKQITGTELTDWETYAATILAAGGTSGSPWYYYAQMSAKQTDLLKFSRELIVPKKKLILPRRVA